MDLIYAKYNSLRQESCRVNTFFLVEEGTIYVEKRPETEAARPHLEAMKKNKALLEGVWDKICPVPFTEMPEGLRFPFVEGEPVFTEPSPSLFTSEKLEELTEAIARAMDEVLAVKEEARVPFEETDEFHAFFGDAEPKAGCPAFSAANLDPVFSNFCRKDGELYCFDYEWAVDFPVPADYLRYRILHYFYWEHFTLFREYISDREFLLRFGIGEEDEEVYRRMEQAFQKRVLGNASYLESFRREEISVTDVFRERDSLRERVQALEAENLSKDGIISARDGEIAGLRHEIELDARKIQNYSKALHNPLHLKKLRADNRKEAEEIEEKDTIIRAIAEATETLDMEDQYDTWIRRIEAEHEKKAKKPLAVQPLISVIVPVYNVKPEVLTACIDSVLKQTYTNWELVLVDDASTNADVKPVMEKMSHDKRIVTEYRRKNGGISKCTNTALSIASGEFIALLDCDDLLSPNALYEVVRRLSDDPELDMIYSDEDKISEDGTVRMDPHFKPEWSPDTLLSHMYTGHLGVYRKSIADEIGGFRSEFDGSQDYDFVLRFTEKTDRISHISRILYHWRKSSSSTAGNEEAKPYVYDSARRAREDSLKRREIPGEVEAVEGTNQFRVRYHVPEDTRVSVVIPSKDHPKLLHRLIFSMKRYTAWKNMEIIVIDNGSSDANRAEYENLSRKYDFRYIYAPMPFHFAQLCNHGAAEAEGDLLLFLNDDTEILPDHGDWLERMAGAALMPWIGAVGAKLLYPNGGIQHTGVLSLQKGPVHALTGMPDTGDYYFSRNKLDVDTLAVTGACLMLRRELYEEMKGFDEDFAIAYNDVDLCMRIIEAGYYNVIRNDAVLLHKESVSRGSDTETEERLVRLFTEQNLLYERHPLFEAKDPFYNRMLAQTNENYGINLEYGKETRVKEIDRERAMRFPEGGSRVNVHVETESDWSLRITGWYFREDMAYTTGSQPKLLLENEEKAYVVSTRQIVNSGLALAYGTVPGVELSAFRAWIPRRKVQPGTYRIWIIAENTRVDTGCMITRAV